MRPREFVLAQSETTATRSVGLKRANCVNGPSGATISAPSAAGLASADADSEAPGVPHNIAPGPKLENGSSCPSKITT